MARFARLQVLNAMVETGMVPVFFDADPERARQVVKAVAAGGCRLLEFTNRGDHAWETFSALERFCRAEAPQMMLGVGSIVDAPTAGLYIDCGAAFVVGPCLNAEVARVCNRRKVAYSPGCGSASEISEAEELGVEIVKVFPGDSVGGPNFVKAILGPCPWTRNDGNTLQPAQAAAPSPDRAQIAARPRRLLQEGAGPPGMCRGAGDFLQPGSQDSVGEGLRVTNEADDPASVKEDRSRYGFDAILMGHSPALGEWCP